MNKKFKIKVFLDIDGVLNNTSDNRKLENSIKKHKSKEFWKNKIEYFSHIKIFDNTLNRATFDFVNRQKLKQFQRLLKNYNHEIYIISSWCNYGGIDDNEVLKYKNYFDLNVVNSTLYTGGNGELRYLSSLEKINEDDDLILYLDDIKIPDNVDIDKKYIHPRIIRGITSKQFKYLKRVIKEKEMNYLKQKTTN